MTKYNPSIEYEKLVLDKQEDFDLFLKTIEKQKKLNYLEINCLPHFYYFKENDKIVYYGLLDGTQLKSRSEEFQNYGEFISDGIYFDKKNSKLFSKSLEKLPKLNILIISNFGNKSDDVNILSDIYHNYLSNDKLKSIKNFCIKNSSFHEYHFRILGLISKIARGIDLEYFGFYNIALINKKWEQELIPEMEVNLFDKFNMKPKIIEFGNFCGSNDGYHLYSLNYDFVKLSK